MDAVVKKKGKKKLLITLIVLAVVIGGILAACSAMTSAAKKRLEAMTAVQTGQVEVRDLISSVGATGKVISLEKEDLSANLSGVEILAVHVEVGDTVKAGQELVAFDTEDIADNLEMARRALQQTQQRNQISTADAQRGVEDAVRNSEFQIDAAARSADTAYENYCNTMDDLDELYDSRRDALRAWEDAEDECDVLYDRQKDVQEKLLLLQEELEGLQETETPETDADTLLAQIGELEAELTALPAQIKQAEAAVSAAEAAYEQTETAVKNMERSVDSMYDGYTTAVKNYNNMVAAQASSVAAAKSGQQSVAASVNTDQQQHQVDLYAQQLEKGILTAPFDGVVTAVNYDPGDLYAQGPILTIQDCSGFEISAQIGEYDIPDIALGQKVLIKTDATRDQELEGTVVFISPTATPVTGMTAADPTYEVKISVDTDTDRLRLDMTANLSIIISEHTNCLTVPYNAVQTAEDGSRFVEVVAEDDTVTEVPVQVLLESNYYTEVTGNLKEGQKVRIIDESSSITDMFEAMASEMGGF